MGVEVGFSNDENPKLLHRKIAFYSTNLSY